MCVCCVKVLLIYAQVANTFDIKNRLASLDRKSTLAFWSPICPIHPSIHPSIHLSGQPSNYPALYYGCDRRGAWQAWSIQMRTSIQITHFVLTFCSAIRNFINSTKVVTILPLPVLLSAFSPQSSRRNLLTSSRPFDFFILPGCKAQGLTKFRLPFKINRLFVFHLSVELSS